MKYLKSYVARVTIGCGEIEAEDITGITDRLSVGSLPEGSELRAHMGSVQLFVEGLEDSSLTFELDPVRRYFSKLIPAWPEWMFLLDFDHQDVRPLVLAGVSKSTYYANDKQARCGLEIATDDFFDELIKPAGIALWEISQKAGMTKQDFRNRYLTVLTKFGVNNH